MFKVFQSRSDKDLFVVNEHDEACMDFEYNAEEYSLVKTGSESECEKFKEEAIAEDPELQQKYASSSY